MWGLSLVVGSGGHSSSQCVGLSLSRLLLLRSIGSRRAGSVVVAHGPGCSVACGIFPDQSSNPCPLHWQADSQPLHHQGSPHLRHFLRFHGPNVDLTPMWHRYLSSMMRFPLHELDFWNKEKVGRFQEGTVLFTDVMVSFTHLVHFAGLRIPHTEIWPVRYCELSLVQMATRGLLAHFRIKCLPVYSVTLPYQCCGPSRSPLLSEFTWNLGRVARDFQEFVPSVEFHGNL